MNVLKDKIRVAVEGPEPPELIETVLRQSTASESFRERCEDAALAGLAMVKLRKQRQKIGFRGFRFMNYVDRLAGSAKTSIEGLTRYYDIKGGAILVDLRGMLRFAYDLGLPIRESVALIKAEAAERADAPLVFSSAAARGGLLDPGIRELEIAIEELLRAHRDRVEVVFQSIDELAKEIYKP